MNTLKIITKTRQLLADPARWTQNCFARDEDGLSVNHTDKSAVCWCLAGAVAKSAGYASPFDDALERVLNEIREDLTCSVVQFNDSATHDQVLAALDKTIARLKPASN